MKLDYRIAVLPVLLHLSGANPGAASVLEVGAAQAYSTIQSCESAAVPGDVCEIHSGEYREVITVDVPSITFRNHPGESPVIVGRFVIAGTPNVTFDCGPNGTLDITGWGSPTTVAWPGIYQANGDGLKVTGCRIHDGYGPGIYSRNSTRLVVSGNEIYGQQHGSGGLSASGITVVSGHAIGGDYDTGSLIEGNLVSDNHVDGIQIHGEYFTIRRNTIRSNLYTDWAATHPDGIQLIAGTVDSFASVKHAKLVANVISNHTQNIFVEGATGTNNCQDVWIVDNVFYQDAGSVHSVSLDTLTANHLVIDDASGVYVFNNTFGRTKSNAIYVTDSNASGSIVIKNNIFSTGIGWGVYVKTPAHIAPGGMDNNLYGVFAPGAAAVTWSTSYYSSREAFNASYPAYEASGVDGDPLLNAFPAPIPLTGSPAIARGVVLPSCADCSVDQMGLARGAVWDIGAFQHGAVPPQNLRLISN